jgi:hypothetical protein
MAQSRLRAIPIITFNTDNLTAEYQLAGSLPVNCSILRLINNSTAIVDVSFDGTHTHDYILANSSVTINAQSNSSPNGNVAQFPSGMPIYLGTGDNEDGTFAIAGYYQSE